jgi:hypothetical protein
MGQLLAWLGSFVGGSFASIFTSVSGAAFQWYAKSKDTTLDGFKTATGMDEKAYEAWLSYQMSIVAAQAASRSWWGPKLLLMLVGVPACLHVAGVFLDSTFRLGCSHYGCLGIPDVPERWVSTETNRHRLRVRRLRRRADGLLGFGLAPSQVGRLDRKEGSVHRSLRLPGNF